MPVYEVSTSAADVATHAAISATSTHGSIGHANTNDPTANQKAALVGTGTPSAIDLYVSDSDARNTNSRVPTAHAASHNSAGSDVLAADAAAGTASLRSLGVTSTTAAAGNDSRLSDARTPTAHASTHTTGADKIATGTPTGLLFLRDDFAWSAPTAAPSDISSVVQSPSGSETLSANLSAVVNRKYTIASGTKLTIGSAARFRIL